MITDDYIAYEHQFDGNSADLSRKDARDRFNHLMEHKNEQVLRLKQLLSKNGLKLTGKSDDIKAINIWLNNNICINKDEFYVDEEGEKHHYIHPDWSNVLFDLSIFLSEIVIQNTKNVSWTFNVKVPRNEISYQHAVLAGFSKVTAKGYYVNFGLALFNYGSQVNEDPDNKTDDFFNYIIEDAILQDVDLEKTMFDHTSFLEMLDLI